MAETALSLLTRQCLHRRIADKIALESEVKAWQVFRNNHNAKKDWDFSNPIARVKLKHLYPEISVNHGTRPYFDAYDVYLWPIRLGRFVVSNSAQPISVPDRAALRLHIFSIL